MIACRKCCCLGEIFRNELKSFKSEMIELVWGKGLLNAVVVRPKNGKTAWDVCLAMKILVL
jgi:ornithine--oxo-acid transaminase